MTKRTNPVLRLSGKSEIRTTCYVLDVSPTKRRSCEVGRRSEGIACVIHSQGMGGRQ